MRKTFTVMAVTLAVASCLAVSSPVAHADPASAPTSSAGLSGLPDPFAPGPYTVTRVLYDAGTSVVGGTTQGVTPYNQELDGDIFYPSAGTGQFGTGPFPLIVFAHGRHGTCTYGNGEIGIQDEELGQCPNTPVTQDVTSYAGYDYLGQLLATEGYIVMSIDLNEVNTEDDASGDEGAIARAEVIAKSLDLMASYDGVYTAPAGDGATGPPLYQDMPGPGTALVGKVDFSRIGVMGHSRGGEGANQFIAYNRTRPATLEAAVGEGDPDYGPTYSGLRAVFALAPIDEENQDPYGVAYGALVPYCDGDVTDLAGTRPFERAVTANSEAGFPSVLFGVNGADHDFFNERWAEDGDDNPAGNGDTACDPSIPGDIRLSVSDQQKIAVATIGVFMRRYVGGETAFDPYITGASLGLPVDGCPGSYDPEPCDQELQTTYIAPVSERHVVLSGSSTTVADDGGAVLATGFSDLSTCTPATSGVGCPGTTATGDSDVAFTDRTTGPQLNLAWDGPSSLVVDLDGPATDASPYAALVIRAAASYTDQARNPAGESQDFTVTLTDTSGHSATVDAAAWSAGALVPSRGDLASGQQEMVLGGIRIPLAQFGGVDLGSLRTATLRFSGKGDVDLSDLAYQEPATPASAGTPPSAVPEGVSPVVLLAGPVLACYGVWRRRRRRNDASRP
jgi:hypothetical protein